MKSLVLFRITLAVIGFSLTTYGSILAQEGTGGGKSGGEMQTGQSGTGKETDAGKGIAGKPSPFGKDQPTSGDFSPKEGSKKDRSQRQEQPKTGGSDYPSGIGEKGTGQASSSERSGASSQTSK